MKTQIKHELHFYIEKSCQECQFCEKKAIYSKCYSFCNFSIL